MNMEDRWVKWIETPEYRNRLLTTEDFVRKLSEKSQDTSYYTPHEAGHCLAVEKMIKALIQKSMIQFTDLEKFILFTAAWIHDLGMFLEVANIFFESQKVPETERSPLHIRDQHDEISAWYLSKNGTSILGIHSDKDVKPQTIVQATLRNYANSINLISQFHRIKNSVDNCPIESFLKGERIRTRLLACLLRLADTLHVDTSRFDRNLYDVLQIGEMDRSARLHWLKSYIVSNVYLDPKTETVFVSIELPKIRGDSPQERADWEESSTNLQRIIVHDIQEDLLTVRGTFMDNSMPAYSQVKARITFVPGYSKEDIEEITGMINDLGVVFSPNTSKVIEKALDSINSICRMRFDRADLARNHIHQLIRYLKDVHNLRPCHIGLAKVIHDTEEVFNKQFPKEEDWRKVTTDEITRRQNAIAKKVNQVRTSRKRGLNKLYDKCKTNVLDGIENIIVFGYSEMVTNFLKEYETHHPNWKDNLTIFVLECSAKRRFTSDNDIEYNDGMYYALQLSKKSFNNIVLLPDTSFASLAYNLNQKNKQSRSLVLFGVNGINRQDYACGHTSGHLMVAIVAKYFKIPVKVIGDRFKIGKVLWKTNAERGTPSWLTGQQAILDSLARQNITLRNYLEDKIPRALLTEIILDGRNVVGKYHPRVNP